MSRKRTAYFIELSWLLFIKTMGYFIPKRLRFRFYKFFYNYQSSRYQGVHLIMPYFESLNLKFIVFTKYLIDWNVFFFGHYEKETNDLLIEHIKPGQTVLEAGANNGTETVLLSRLVGPEGKVLAFEPIAHIYETLKLNLSLNHCSNVIAEQLALGSRPEELYFNVLPEDYCNQGMASKYDGHSQDNKVLVQQTSVDTWMTERQLTTVDFIKMDIQGAEIDLLKGAQKTILASKPIIFAEAAEKHLSILELYETLEALEYTVYYIETGGHLRLLSKTSLVSGNWLAKPCSTV